MSADPSRVSDETPALDVELLNRVLCGVANDCLAKIPDAATNHQVEFLQRKAAQLRSLATRLPGLTEDAATLKRLNGLLRAWAADVESTILVIDGKPYAKWSADAAPVLLESNTDQLYAYAKTDAARTFRESETDPVSPNQKHE